MSREASFNDVMDFNEGKTDSIPVYSTMYELNHCPACGSRRIEGRYEIQDETKIPDTMKPINPMIIKIIGCHKCRFLFKIEYYVKETNWG